MESPEYVWDCLQTGRTHYNIVYFSGVTPSDGLDLHCLRMSLRPVLTSWPVGVSANGYQLVFGPPDGGLWGTSEAFCWGKPTTLQMFSIHLLVRVSITCCAAFCSDSDYFKTCSRPQSTEENYGHVILKSDFSQNFDSSSSLFTRRKIRDISVRFTCKRS